MLEENSTVDELSNLKARYEEKGDVVDLQKDKKNINVVYTLAPHLLRFLAILLAIFSTIFLVVAYTEVLNIRSRESELNNKVAQIDDYDRRISKLSETTGDLESKRDQLKEELVELGSKVANTASTAANNRIDSEAQIRLKEEEARLEGVLPQLREEDSRLRKNAGELEARLRESQTAYDNEQNQLLAIHKSVESSRPTLNNLQSEITTKIIEAAGLSSQIQDQTKDLEELSADLKDKKAKLEVMNAKKALLVETTASLEQQENNKYQLESEFKTYEVKLGELKKQVAKLESKKVVVERTAAEIETRRQTFDDLGTEIDKSNIKLAEIREISDEKSRALEIVNDELSRAGTELAKARRELEELAAKHTLLIEERAELERAVGALQEKNRLAESNGRVA